MAEIPPLPTELTDRLQDEALADRCFHAFKPEQSAAAALTRIPFAIFSAAKSRSPFANAGEAGESAAVTEDPVARERAKRLRAWAADRVREQLDVYMLAASPEYQAYHELPQLELRWRSTVDGIGELLIAFAREVRTLLMHQTKAVRPAPDAAFEPLRKIVGSLAGVSGHHER